MNDRYGEPVEVARQADFRPERPTAFIWQGRLYRVNDVLASWREDSAGHGVGREVWRVAASAGRSSPLGSYDLWRELPSGVGGRSGPPCDERWRVVSLDDSTPAHLDLVGCASDGQATR